MTTNTITDLKSIKAKFVCGEERKKDEKSRRKKIVMGAAEEKGERVMCACWWWSGDWARGWLSFLGGGKLPHLLLFFFKNFLTADNKRWRAARPWERNSLSPRLARVDSFHQHIIILFTCFFFLSYCSTRRLICIIVLYFVITIFGGDFVGDRNSSWARGSCPVMRLIPQLGQFLFFLYFADLYDRKTPNWIPANVTTQRQPRLLPRMRAHSASDG